MAGGPSIFVNVAAYRDPELAPTLRDLFARAADPGRVVVGICLQTIPGADFDCQIPPELARRCRVDQVDARESLGVCWARHRAQSLWQGEAYTLHIDSHMRFMSRWDRILLEMHAQCPSPRAAISTYPPPYDPPDHLDRAAVADMHAEDFDADGLVRVRARSRPPDPHHPPRRHPFVAAGFLFAAAEMIGQVPYDPYLYFHGEEITLAVRLFTHGWDVFAPNRCALFHDYGQGRHRHWQDHPDWVDLNWRSLSRVRHLLGIEESHDPAVLVELDRYGLGDVRNIVQFQDFAGIDFKMGKVSRNS